MNLYIKRHTLFVRLKGEMDQETCLELKSKLQEVIIKYDINNLVFNMQELYFMDSSGVGVIIGRYNQIKHKGGRIILCSLNEQIERIVILSGLPKICLIKENEEIAKEYLEVYR